MPHLANIEGLMDQFKFVLFAKNEQRQIGDSYARFDAAYPVKFILSAQFITPHLGPATEVFFKTEKPEIWQGRT